MILYFSTHFTGENFVKKPTGPGDVDGFLARPENRCVAASRQDMDILQDLAR
jgi:hypothetical protein